MSIGAAACAPAFMALGREHAWWVVTGCTAEHGYDSATANPDERVTLWCRFVVHLFLSSAREYKRAQLEKIETGNGAKLQRLHSIVQYLLEFVDQHTMPQSVVVNAVVDDGDGAGRQDSPRRARHRQNTFKGPVARARQARLFRLFSWCGGLVLPLLLWNLGSRPEFGRFGDSSLGLALFSGWAHAQGIMLLLRALNPWMPTQDISDGKPTWTMALFGFVDISMILLFAGYLPAVVYVIVQFGFTLACRWFTKVDENIELRTKDEEPNNDQRDDGAGARSRLSSGVPFLTLVEEACVSLLSLVAIVVLLVVDLAGVVLRDVAWTLLSNGYKMLIRHPWLEKTKWWHILLDWVF